MSQSLKQTTLNLNRWKKRPVTDNRQDRDRSVRPTTPSVSQVSHDKATRLKGSQAQTKPTSIAPTTKLPSPDALPRVSIPLPETASLSFNSHQLPLASSSQRIVRNGERMVTDSDENDDSSSLEDLDNLITLKEGEDGRVHFGQADGGLRGGSGALQRTSGHNKAASDPQLAAKATEYQYSLAALAEQRRYLQTSGEDVAKVNALLDARRQPPSMTGQSPNSRMPPDESLIDAVMNERGDEEDVGRLKDALRRTEALYHDNMWSFFHARPEPEVAGSLVFPELQNDPLQPILQHRRSRQQAFLNGFVEDYATKGDLPDELVLWILDSVCSEKQQDLRLSYVHVLKELSLRNQNFLNCQRIENLFRKIGATDEALEMQKPISTSFTLVAKREGFIQDHLDSILGLIQSLAGTLEVMSSKYAICTVCRLLLDHLVVSNCSLLASIAETLNSLIESFPDRLYERVLQDVLPTIYGSIDDPTLRLQLIRNLPVYTYRTAVFRRRLALAFFFHDREYLMKPEIDSIVDLTSIATYIETPRFAINKKTDYAQLMASMALLDIGIDMGDPVLPFRTSKEEQNFDSAVDLLSTRLKGLSTQIVGASTLNMRRTESKEIIDAIQRRLSYTVRSRPLLKTSILGSPAAGQAGEKERMTEYLDHARSKAVSGSPVDVINTSNEQIFTHRR